MQQRMDEICLKFPVEPAHLPPSLAKRVARKREEKIYCVLNVPCWVEDFSLHSSVVIIGLSNYSLSYL
jgi:hypothetical protein